MIMSVCSFPVSAATISLDASNIEVVDALQGILKVSGVLTNDTVTENRYITVLALPNGTPVTSYAGNTYKNADEIKAAFDIAVADAPTSGVVPGPGPGGGGGGSTQEPEEIKTKITVENETCRAGETISVPVIIENNTGLAGLIIECTYDSAFSLISIENGTALSNLELTVSGDLTANPVKLLWDGMEADNSNGKIAILTFKVANNAEIGNYNISLTVKTACDQALQDVGIDTVDGIISVIDYIPGDVNEDKTVNVKDVIMARRYIAGGYGVNILEDAADVNADDVLTVKDIILMRRFVVGGYGVELN